MLHEQSKENKDIGLTNSDRLSINQVFSRDFEAFRALCGLACVSCIFADRRGGKKYRFQDVLVYTFVSQRFEVIPVKR